MAAPSSPPEVDENFGVHYPDWFVKWSVDAMRAWHIPPPVWLDVPETFILDIIRWINQSDAVEEAAKDSVYFGDVNTPDFLDKMMEAEDTQRITFGG